uniref:Uncharacterized protein n=1 Tax=Chromera velia CCMP2878 TaxID=1169474 RepID=A0A0G4HHM1_9ALVE|mmetsp:Transcript_28957/g.56661  ORF Transcript_28957/g.56661 Transcript_28957/m.56661 type:complete len:474 (+) Transcript_28957:140-1561(+)|eukprot:Cvel_27543.t1-p1 / transcript=Cvel_27543.t1 / gene=Cvel_27543 / organism=Chromera_velia_CCMP2878 / gene_product=hypothetical protein / transcript_product=hypothetical protein / location=Cvel_scaffold3456:15100-16518(+) / protein_length=473 / sequence_SO=supercontig / SO=protein_coding / is_pseudo=false
MTRYFALPCLFFLPGSQSQTFSSSARLWSDPFSDFLDAISFTLTGHELPERSFYPNLTQCFHEVDADLLSSQKAAWNGFGDFWTTHGTTAGDDFWDVCAASEQYPHYQERNASALSRLPAPYSDLVIYEPCNVASNIAYYQALLLVCDRKDSETGLSLQTETVRAVVQSMAGIGFASSLWHGSHTKLGHTADNRLIDVCSLVIHQGLLLGFGEASGVQSDPVLFHLQRANSSSEDLPPTGVEIAGRVTDMFRLTPVNEWRQTLEGLSVPGKNLTFGAIILSWLSLVLSSRSVQAAVRALSSAFKLAPEDLGFLLDSYLPAFTSAAEKAGITLPLRSREERRRVSREGGGTLSTLLFAFLWQENFFGPSADHKRMWKVLNRLGARMMRPLNMFFNRLAGFFAGKEAPEGRILLEYPGAPLCRRQSAHAKWHEESGLGLVDLLLLADDVFRVFEKEKGRAEGKKRGRGQVVEMYS